MRNRQRSPAVPARDAVASVNVLKEFLRRSAVRRFRVGRAGKNSAVIIRTCYQDLAPRLRVRWLEPLMFSKAMNCFRSQRPKNKSCGVTQQRIAKSIDPFEVFEQQDQLLDMISRQLTIHVVERMRHGV